MKSLTYPILGATFLLCLAFFLGRCSVSDPALHSDATTQHHPAPQSSSKATAWTCSMHPQIKQPEPGACPICGMDLIPLASDFDTAGERALSMSEASKALAEIQTTEVLRDFPEVEVRLVGTLAYDQTKVQSLSARFPARIEELFINFTGVPVTKGDHLARVYSPELLTAQSELLTSYRFNPDSSATRAAREKLRLWGLLPEQINAIIEQASASDTFELKAPISGIVVSKNVNEGAYLKTGDPLFTIVDLKELWLQLEAYESDLAWLHLGQALSFTVQSFPGQSFDGKVTFIEPEFDRDTRTVSVRVNVPNPDSKLKPGMFARATALAKIASDGRAFAPEYAGKWISPMHPEIVKEGPGQCDICGMELVPAEELGYVQNAAGKPPIIVPTTAVLRTGKRSIVYVEVPNTDRPTYEGREIEIGPRAGEYFTVISGLSEGERVVSNGAFKIDSALQIQAKPSMMNLSPSAPPEVIAANETETDAQLQLDPETASSLISHYLELQASLAGDDLQGAKKAARSMMQSTGHSGPLPDLLHHMLSANTLDALRRPHFELLSDAFIKAVFENPDAFPEALYQMHCPMVYPDRGADWLQPNKALENPYFGATMLTCGEIKRTWDEFQGAKGSEL